MWGATLRDLRPYHETLSSMAHPDGGWGYLPGQPLHVEPTCLALLALAHNPESFRSAIEQARSALAKSVQSDGTYRIERSRPSAVWPTSMALFVQTVLKAPATEIDKTA